MDVVVSFKVKKQVDELLELDAKRQFSSVSAILRQIVHKHYGIDSIPSDKKAHPKRTSRDCGYVKSDAETTAKVCTTSNGDC